MYIHTWCIYITIQCVQISVNSHIYVCITSLQKCNSPGNPHKNSNTSITNKRKNHTSTNNNPNQCTPLLLNSGIYKLPTEFTTKTSKCGKHAKLQNISKRFQMRAHSLHADPNTLLRRIVIEKCKFISEYPRLIREFSRP